MTNRVIHYEMDVNMSLSHEGLAALAKKGGRSVAALKPGEFIMFINHPFTAFKIFGAFNTFAYHRSPSGHALDPKALLKMVACFDGVTFDYRTALAEAIMERLPENVQRAIRRDRERGPVLKKAARKQRPPEKPNKRRR